MSRTLLLLVVLLLLVASRGVQAFTPMRSPVRSSSIPSTRTSARLPLSTFDIHAAPGRRGPLLTPLRAWPTGRDPKSFAKDFPLTAARVGITVLATALTYVAHANQRCGPVLASSAVTLAGSLVAPGLGQVRVCGQIGIRLVTPFNSILFSSRSSRPPCAAASRG